MAVGEVSGFVELGQWSTLPDGREVLVQPTKHIRRFRITIKEKPPTTKVRHRRYHGRYLTEGQ